LYQQNWSLYFCYHSGQHNYWWPTSAEHAPRSVCHRSP
jgi:hypothetical protein